MDRRGFLRGILAAAAAPAIVKAEVLMPVRRVIRAPQLYTGEVGFLNCVWFIESIGPSDHVLDVQRDLIHARHGSAETGALTIGAIHRAAKALDRQRTEEPVFIVHPEWADRLRSLRVPVKPDPRRLHVR